MSATFLEPFGKLVYWREFDGRMVAPAWLVHAELLTSSDPRARGDCMKKGSRFTGLVMTLLAPPVCAWASALWDSSEGSALESSQSFGSLHSRENGPRIDGRISAFR